MDIPAFAQTMIQDITQSVPLKQLELASTNLTQKYRKKESGNHLQDALSIEAYLATRLPATYSVATQVLLELKQLTGDALTGALLDLGAGPGTVSLAASQIFPELHQIHLYEINREMISAGKKIFSSGPELLTQARWHCGSLSERNLDQAELSVAAYVLNELSSANRSKLIEALTQRTDRFLIFIEPGTPEGYQNLIQTRMALNTQGWNTWAPCPHQLKCPLSNDWCHFSARLPRSALHRHLKKGSKGHEDEKFSYLIMSREPPPDLAHNPRIIRHPGIHKGHIRLTLCQQEGVSEQIVSKRDAYFKLARKIRWGQQWQG